MLSRGVSGAYCDAPGPMETHGETFYAIEPTPTNWTPERVNSYYREYNSYMVHELTVHEVMPGHYVQPAIARGFRAPTLVRALFQSGTFVEGWACYAEQTMAELGCGGPEVRTQQLKNAASLNYQRHYRLESAHRGDDRGTGQGIDDAARLSRGR